MTRNHITRHGLWALGAALFTLLFFGSANAADPPTGTVRQGLVGGTEVDERTQEIYGLLKLSDSSGSCTASLLRNDWAISAAHCVDATDRRGNTMPNPNRPGQNILNPIGGFKIEANWGGGQTKKATRIDTFWPYDISLIHLDSPVQVNGKTTGYVREVFLDQFPYFGTPVGVVIKTFGRGINQFAFGSGNTATPSQMDGKFRVASFKTTREKDALYWYPSENGKMVAGGDSGGPSFATVGTSQTTVLVGVHALALTERVPGKPTNGWTWVTKTTEAADAPVKPVWPQILQIMGPVPQIVVPPEPKNTYPEFRPGTTVFDTSVRADEFNILYAVAQNGDLIWRRHQMALARGSKSVEKHGWKQPSQVGTGWASGFREILPGGTNTIYAIEDGGTVRWYKHNGSLNGTHEWQGPVNVQTGWNTFKHVVAMGQGVFYAVLPSGDLLWLKHNEWQNPKPGNKGWSSMMASSAYSMGGRRFPMGWGNYTKMFGGGNGVIYAVAPDGKLYWFRHLTYLNPQPEPQAADMYNPMKAAQTAQWMSTWQGPNKVGDGWGEFTKIFSSGEGHIYALRPNGDLMYHRHHGWANGSYVWDEGSTRKIAEGWDAFKFAFARNTTSDAGSRDRNVDIVVN